MAPPPSQPMSKIFYQRSGDPLYIFVDALGVDNRPKLIRSLRDGGAVICSRPVDAQIVIVNSESESGGHFVNTWAVDKVVLETSWARASLKAGKALLAQDKWGKFRRFPKGQSDVDSSEDNNPLPTPRPTPTGPVPRPDERDSTPLSHSSGGGQSRYAQPPASQAHEHAWNTSAPGLSTRGESSSSAPQPSQVLVPNSFMQPTPEQMFAMFAQSAMSNPAMMQAMQQLVSATMNDPQSFNSMPYGMMPTLPNFPSSNNINMPSPSNAYGSAGFPPLFSHQQAPSSDYYPPSQSQYSSQERPAASPADMLLSRSLGRRASSPPSLPEITTLSHQSKSKGKRRASRSLSPRQPRFNGTPSQAPSSGIFREDDGKPYTFWIAVEKPRAQIVQKVKQHGGKIVSDQKNAAYVILFRGTNDFASLYNVAVASGQRPLRPEFVIDSAEQGELLDWDDYLLEPPSSKRKIGRPAKKPRKQRDDSPLQLPPEDEDEDEDDPPPASHPINDEATFSPSSPPPPTGEPQYYQKGKVKYSLAEREFVATYVPILLARNPDFTLQELSKKLHGKMPAHSAPSWRSYLRDRLPEIEAWRQQAAVTRAEGDEHRSPGASQNPEEQASAIRSASATPPPPTEPDSAAEPEVPLDAWGQDFAAITHYLGTVADLNVMDDERIWEDMKALHPCRTALSWGDFYSGNEAQVVTRVKEMFGSPDVKVEESANTPTRA